MKDNVNYLFGRSAIQHGAKHLSLVRAMLSFAASITIFMITEVPINAMDFLEKRNCTLHFPGGALRQTICIVSGGMQGGVIDLEIEGPGGKKYSLEGPIDGESGQIFLLQGSKAKVKGRCYNRLDGKLSLCLMEKQE
jgi:hypothetical protein